jgi:quinol monooxygenase YgiN
MIIRLVRMHFTEDSSKQFLTIFQAHQNKIRHVSGCTHLELLREPSYPYTFTTLSHWGDASDLEAYRQSTLFKTVWSQVKPLFSQKAETFSFEKFIEV